MIQETVTIATKAISTKAVATMLCCHVKIVRRMVHSGELNGFFVGRIMRVELESVENFIRSGNNPRHKTGPKKK